MLRRPFGVAIALVGLSIGMAQTALSQQPCVDCRSSAPCQSNDRSSCQTTCQTGNSCDACSQSCATCSCCPCECQSACECDCKDECDGCGECGCGCDCESGVGCYLFVPGSPWTMTKGENFLRMRAAGWLQGGYHTDPTPLSRVRGDGLAFNDVPDSFNMQQAWMYFERGMDFSERDWDWGFRFDFLYGTDAQKTQAFGGFGWDTTWDNGVYGWALPQAYFEVGTERLSVKMGHFFTIIGYEVIPAPDNFFYSHSLTMFNTEPFTHTGVLASYQLRDDVQVFGGWTAGWDTGFESVNGGSNFIGGCAWSVTDWMTATYINSAGNFGLRGSRAYSHSMVFDVTVTEKMNYVVQSDMLSIDSADDHDIGVNQYMFYTINDCVKLGGRLEWWKDNGVSFYQGTYGVNYRPHANFIVRPEVRHDWSPVNRLTQTTFGIDGIFTF